MFWICGRTQTVDCLPLEKAKEIYIPENIKNAKTDYQKFACQVSMPKVLETMVYYNGTYPIITQGELCGRKIQKNRLELQDDNYKYYIFNMKIGGEYKGKEIMEDKVSLSKDIHNGFIEVVNNAFPTKMFEIKNGKIVAFDKVDYYKTEYTFEEFSLQLDKIKYKNSTKSIEGVVMRPISSKEYVSEYPNFEHNLKSFKIINPNYK